MSKHFIISKEVREGTLVTEEQFVFEFDRDDKVVRVNGRQPNAALLGTAVAARRCGALAVMES